MGVVLYFPGTDILQALYKSLYYETREDANHKFYASDLNKRIDELESFLDAEQNFFPLLSSMILKLNEKHIAKQCDANTKQYKGHRQELDKLDLLQLEVDMDPVIWNLITLLTSSSSERAMLLKNGINNFNWKEHCTSIFQFESKYDLRRFTRKIFLTYTLLFCTDQECGYPLHVLLADFVTVKVMSLQMF